MALPIVSLDSDFTVYADVDMADTYLDGASHADTWRALTDDDTKGRYLVTATRILNRQLWKGDKVASDQPLAWPRTNTGIDDSLLVLDTNGIPVDIDNAAIELALAIADGSEVQNQQTTVERVRSMTAGSVSITNFRGIDIPTRFPQIVQELLRLYLGGTGSTFVPKATGTDGETSFPAELGFNIGGI
jgi:hypothetical protein